MIPPKRLVLVVTAAALFVGCSAAQNDPQRANGEPADSDEGRGDDTAAEVEARPATDSGAAQPGADAAVPQDVLLEQRAKGFLAFLHSVTDPIAMRTNADRDALFAQVFGPQLLQETVGDRLQFDNTYSAGRRLDHLARLDGKPVLGMWLSAGIFFYQPTMLDLTTGAVYQGDIVPGHVYAPLLPPSDVRLSGDFTPSQIALLKKALSAF